MDITFETLLEVVERLGTISSAEAWLLYGVVLGSIGLGMLLRKLFERHCDKAAKKADWDEIVWETGR